MPTLAEMMAKQKLSNQSQQESNGESKQDVGNPTDAPSTGGISLGAVHAQPDNAATDATNQPESIPPTGANQASTGTPAPARLGLLKLGGGIKQPAADDSGDRANPEGATVTGESDADRVSDSKPRNDPPASGLLQLAGSTSFDAPSTGLPKLIGDLPSDHVNPEAPERVLPAELTEQQAGFVKSLDSLYLVFDDADLFVGVVARIMGEMRGNAHLKGLIHDDDARTMIVGIRAAAGMAQVKKRDASEKRSSGKKSSTKVDSAVVADIKALAGFGGFDD